MKLHRYGAFAQIDAPINLKEARKSQQQAQNECRKQHETGPIADTAEQQVQQPEASSKLNPKAEVASEAIASPTVPYPSGQPILTAGGGHD
ncbi:hypothetical protein [Comamonas testosteroni]|uniref:hypothetical protein n=1 Tax=Comamonas testosteroni TaxID=285 RepID=UPI0012D2DE57|nr:hypothetical protein [Comamonas testosteroni]